jgi:hypothetical protein
MIAACLAACGPGETDREVPAIPALESPAGLAALPCDRSEPLAPLRARYCEGRNFLRPEARDVMIDTARALAEQHPDTVIHFMDGSGPDGVKPFPPHRSHGDGRQLDVALFFETLEGEPLAVPPDTSEYGGWWPSEPPRPGERIACPQGRSGAADKPDPPTDRDWRLDEVRTRALIQLLVDDPRVRRILIEPHLEERLGFWGHPKLRFAGCEAARHDDHLHVDFH